MDMSAKWARVVLRSRNVLLLALALVPAAAAAQEETGRYGSADYHVIYNDPNTTPPNQPVDVPVDPIGQNISYRFSYLGPDGGSFYDPANWQFNASGRPGGFINGNGITGTFVPEQPSYVADITRPDGSSASPPKEGYDPIHYISQYATAIGSGTGVVFDPIGEGQADTVYSLNVLYVGGLTGGDTQNGTLTIKSGTIEGRATFFYSADGSTIQRQPARFIIGRNNKANAQGTVYQTGGTYRQIIYNNAGSPGNSNFIQLGDVSNSTGGRGTYDYSGGIIENSGAGTATQVGMLIGAANDGDGKFIMRSPTAPGYVRMRHMLVANGQRSTGIVEFHYGDGGVRPFQVMDSLSLRNDGTTAPTNITRSSMLDFKLDKAPTLTAGVPLNIGLFDIDFDADGTGVINGAGAGGKTGARFYGIDGTTLLQEGSTVSATYLGSTYNWTISYTGTITWTDANTSVVGSVTGPAVGGKDIVLVGLSSVIVPAPRPGDFNLDGDVDSDDLAAWNLGYGTGTTVAQGDADNDHDVDGQDFLLWQQNFGPAPGVNSVPEPASATLLALGMAVAALGGRRRRS